MPGINPNVLKGRHSSTVQAAKWFEFGHLEGILRTTSQYCCELAETMIETLPDGPELTLGLRSLSQAKDYFVHAAIESLEQA